MRFKTVKFSVLVFSAFVSVFQVASVTMAAPVAPGTPILMVDGNADSDLTITPTIVNVNSAGWNFGQVVGGVFTPIGTVDGGALVDFAIQSISNPVIIHSLTSAVSPSSVLALTTFSGPSLSGQEQVPNPVGDYYNTIDIKWYVNGGLGVPFEVVFGNAGPTNDGFAAVPLPPAALLFGTGLIGLIGIARRRFFV